ncbi:MAG: ABC transporter substrate-binding protein [Thermotogae bacterium]|nr:ABC transporter substrate-binding protein [Thermotogota bacterium]HOO74086.1 ABC transporter substrate-binding protein [Tepiditoga sp.]
MKKLLMVLITILSIVVVMGETGVSYNEIKVGSFQAMSGAVALIGQNMAKGMQAYFNYVNDNGGVNGRKINLIIADDQFNPAKTTVEVKRLVESDGVFAMVGGLGTPGCLAVMDYLNTSKVPFVYQGSGSSLLAIPPKQYVFPVQPNYTLEGNIVINHLIKDKNAKRIAVIYRNADDGKEFYASAKKAMEANGMKFAAELAVNTTANDFSTELTKLIAARVDGIALMVFSPQSANFVKQARQYGLKSQPIVMSYANSDVTFITLAGEAAEGVEAMAWVNVDFSNPDLQSLRIFEKYYNEIPNAYAIAGMIAAETFTEGVIRAGKNLTRESLVKALETLDKWTGMVAHEITYKPYSPTDETSRLGKQSMYVLQVQNGTWVNASDWIEYTE